MPTVKSTNSNSATRILTIFRLFIKYCIATFHPLSKTIYTSFALPKYFYIIQFFNNKYKLVTNLLALH